MANEVPQKPSDVQVLWKAVWKCLNSVLALLIILGAHKVLTLAFEWTFQERLGAPLVRFIETVIAVIFTAIYVYLGWEALTAFLPFLKDHLRRLARERAEDEGL